MAELQHILEGLALLSVTGFIGSLLIHVLETITAPGYVPKKERLRRAALEKKRNHKIKS
jgi:hypothetical protein